MSPSENDPWLVRPSSIRLMWRGGIALLIVFTLVDILAIAHPHFGVDGTFGFYSWFGLATCAAMVLIGKGLGLFLARPDRYYENE